MSLSGSNQAAGRSVEVDIQVPGVGVAQQPWYEDAVAVYQQALTMTDAQLKQVDGKVLLAAVTIGYSRFSNASREITRLDLYDRLNASMRKDAMEASVQKGDAWRRIQRLLGTQG